MTSPTLPLHCSICPKRPDFSDVSHLLTHIASKGHLSHYYKTKVRSAQDFDARALVDAYDTWYDEWSVEELMAERLALKEKKSNRRRGQATRTEPTRNAIDAGLYLPPPLPFSMDPRLPVMQYSYETPLFAKAELPTPPFFDEEPEPVTLIKSNRPRLHLWPTNRPTSSEAIPLEQSSPLAYATRSAAQRGSAQTAPCAPMHSGRRRSTTNTPLEDDAISEAAKLKGVLWPGMDIFDAATPEMKRKRNQKKEVSVVERLERYAEDVDPSEMIFTPSGSLWKQRPISGQVDFDSSPYKLDGLSPEPPTKLRATAKTTKRVPLAAKDSNASRRRGMLRGNASAAPLYAAINTQPTAKSPKKRKRKIAMLDERQEQPFGNPTGMRYLTSEFHYNPQARHEQAHAQNHLLDSNFAQFYQPALQRGYFPDLFDPMQQAPMHQAVYGLPYYAPYARVGYDIPGFFSYPPQIVPTQADEKQESAGDEPVEEGNADIQAWEVKLLTDADVLQTQSQN